MREAENQLSLKNDEYAKLFGEWTNEAVRIKEIDHTIRYRTSTTGNWVEIAPNQCPYDIDVSDIPLYVNVAGATNSSL